MAEEMIEMIDIDVMIDVMIDVETEEMIEEGIFFQVSARHSISILHV
jgi:hypothetical protein